ncbi:MAG TPA: phosphoenolpyruvate synthase regulatory protein [Peptococcaceae bacterium]|nr:phosphoenolpyruvate synthase regulatory protein [Peptococcaceae bacterium]
MLIYVLSDSIGETGAKVVQAAVSQFAVPDLEIRRFPFVREESSVMQAIDEFKKQKKESELGLIAHTLVSPELRAFTRDQCALNEIPTMDILGPYVDQVSQLLHLDPRLKPGLTHQIDNAYHRRVESIEFAIRYDDGKDSRGIKEADVVLIGISRTSKTPLCMYLAYHAIKAANIPLVPETPVPEELFHLPRFRVIGLTIRPEVLHSIRANRLREMGLQSDANYANLERILMEIEFAESVMKKIGCPIIDISNKAMEETAGKIMQIMQRSVE